MIPEKKFKENLINSLNKINPGWIDGDKERKSGRKVDIINHQLKIAIEIKDDTCWQLAMTPAEEKNEEKLEKINKRLMDHAVKANRKFSEYQNYKTILLFRTKYPSLILFCYTLEGPLLFRKLKDSKYFAGRKRKYRNPEFCLRNIGSIVIYSDPEGIVPEWGYFPNKFGENNRILKKREIEKLFGYKFIKIKSITESDFIY